MEVPAHQNPKPGRVYQCHNPDQRKITTCVCVMYYLYYVSDCAYRCKVLVWSSRRVIIVEGRGLAKDFFLFVVSGRFSTTLLPSWTIISIISDNHNFPTKAGSPLEAVKSIATMKLSSIPP